MKKHTGLGFRRDIAHEIIEGEIFEPSFIELAPENWIDIGGYWRKKLHEAAEKYPITTHGLSLSIGSPEDLDWDFLRKIKKFNKEFGVKIYSEHLSYTKAENAHLYDLLPIPFRMDAVKHVVDRIRRVQDFLGQRIAIENVSYYTPVAAEMTESEFVSQIANEADCDLLLDVNNVYVNAFNHKYNARQYIESLPLEKVAYIHMAGHLQVNEELIIDTHGQAIIDPVYELFEWTLERVKPVPVLLERDFNLENTEELSTELNELELICQTKWENKHATIQTNS
ncbi:MAG: DUF692 domain-containing protein [Bacteroidales bacterium]|nr:DUF692 domain-containing protein [Bacteroidales bacterium]